MYEISICVRETKILDSQELFDAPKRHAIRPVIRECLFVQNRQGYIDGEATRLLRVLMLCKSSLILASVPEGAHKGPERQSTEGYSISRRKV